MRAVTRNRLGYVRNHALVFFKHCLNSSSIQASKDRNNIMAICMNLIGKVMRMRRFLQTLRNASHP